MHDKTFMQKALSLAAKGKGRTSPNPMVGAVIVKGGKIVAADYHRKAGTPHAEVLALKKAGKDAKDATLYVTLEPCCHTGKRTPPCTKAIIQSGIKKVVAAMIDPNPRVSGTGLKELREAGIETTSGLMEEEARELNEAFIKYITKKEAFVILKIAQSLDGKIATASGESKWITGEKAREYVHKLRSEVDAVLVGIGTVKKDDPSLDCRIKNGRDPYRIIVDGNLQIPLEANVLKHNDNKTIVATLSYNPPLPPFAKGGDIKSPFGKGGCRGIFSKKWSALQKKIDLLNNMGIRILQVKDKNGKVDLKALMKELGKLDITSVMIEGGSSISASALSSGIVDKVLLFIAPKIIGGKDSFPSVGGSSPALLKDALRIKNLQARKIGEDFLLEGYL
ncbi:MAG: bifunctional diaminohydroxyphosphoribosylaminopyrimidine deaminase/5-amino-6-(5-phosphoribosylamino)uracil reductase RibD [Nitrospirae bacterium]|nr:bifunctional diaminohydroxyphosphoribosylaminopyrimidine deaminase/5-amino-6-(5-phosphoribosylamino)uracil reductase RibD [Nitrospirota bacterium]